MADIAVAIVAWAIFWIGVLVILARIAEGYTRGREVRDSVEDGENLH